MLAKHFLGIYERILQFLPVPLAAAGALGLCGSLLAHGTGSALPELIPVIPPETATGGEGLARIICASCHIFPPPDLVDQKTWQEHILPRMETRLGVTPPDYSSSPEGELLRELKLYPDEPLIPKADWNSIFEFYMKAAPAVPVPQRPRPPIKVGLKQFAVAAVRFRQNPPTTTLVHFSPAHRQIFLGDDQAQSLTVLDGKGQRLKTIPVGNVPVALVEAEQGLYVTGIGSFIPSEVQRGALLFFEKQGTEFAPAKAILENLPRAVQTEFCDFDGDGKLDFAMCLFGNHRGRFSWFKNLGNGAYEEQCLWEKSGPIHCAVRDFDGNGTPDIGLLIAQQSEAFYLFLNDGKGNFSNELVFQHPPSYGHDYFELADFDGNGRMDLLVVNGDSGDYESPAKNYHGLRVYLDRGTNQFEEAFFFPLNGATKAVARDFDEDGDLDLAAISFFPDYVDSPRESFVYLENRGGFDYVPATFPQCISGRWLVMDVGDVDGDRDLDLILGSYVRGPTRVPSFLKEMWEKQGPSALILRNTLR